MKEVILNNKNYLLIEIPDDSNTSEIDENFLYVYSINGKLTFALQAKSFTNCKLIGKVSDILKDEEICKGMVDKFSLLTPVLYVNYLNNFYLDKQFDKATDSFKSWLESIELDLTKQYLLVEKL